MSGGTAPLAPAFQTTPLADLVFGLEWFALIGSDGMAQGRRLARRYRASHLVVSQLNAGCAGLALLQGVRPSARPWCAAALVVACRYPQATVGLVCKLQPGLWWMVAVHDGAVVTRSDKLFDSGEAAREALDGLMAFYPGLVRLDPAEGGRFDWLDASVVAMSRLQEWRKGHQRRRRVIRLVLLSMLGAGGASAYVANRDVSPLAAEPADAAALARQAWQDAQQLALQRHWLHGTEGTAGAMQSLYRLPVRLAGWRLKVAQCVAQRTAWRCQADYGRQHPLASNRQFMQAAPASWKVSFTPLEQAQATWTIQSRGSALDKALLNRTADNEATLFSQLQSIRPALPRVIISSATPLAVSAPVDDQGEPLERPPDLPRYRLRNVEFHVPLRSASLLLPYVRHMGWERIVLTLAESSRPSLAHSSLMARLKGVLYETEN